MNRDPHSAAVGALHLALRDATEMGIASGIPPEAQGALLLAAATALLGPGIGFERNGQILPADLTLTVVTPGPGTPKWLGILLDALLEAGKAAPLPRNPLEPSPAKRTSHRRNLGVLERLGLGHTDEADGLRFLLGIKPVGRRMLANTLAPANGRYNGGNRPEGVVAVGDRQVLGALSGNRPPLRLAWTDTRGWAKLARALGVAGTAALGWVLEPPQTGQPPNEEIWIPAALRFMDRLQRLRSNPEGTIRTLVPGREVAAMAACEHHIGALADGLPPCLRADAALDRLLPWRLAAILSAVYLDGTEPWRDDAQALFAVLAAEWAGWLAQRHVRLIRNTFPCDGDGYFTPAEQAVFRQLGDPPARLREIQRGLRGRSTADCQRALQRAEGAGLALREPTGMWRLAP